MNKMAEQDKKTLTVQQKVTYFYCFLIPYENNLCNLAWLIILHGENRATDWIESMSGNKLFRQDVSHAQSTDSQH